MYSYEERIRAVKLYIKLGKRTGPTIRQLGYPSKKITQGLVPRVRTGSGFAGGVRPFQEEVHR
jgi:hypothetical protein